MPTDPRPQRSAEDTLRRIERRAASIWIRRRLVVASAAATIVALVAVPGMALRDDGTQTVQAASPNETGPGTRHAPAEPSPSTTTTSPDVSPLPEPAPPGTLPPTTATSAPTTCEPSGAPRSTTARDGGLEVTVEAPGAGLCAGQQFAIRVTTLASPTEALTESIDFGDGHGFSDPQPALDCGNGASRGSGGGGETYDHAYEAPGDYAVVIRVTSYACSEDGGVTSDDVTVTVLFTVRP